MAVSEQLRALLEAGVHFGHQTRRWNPKMRRFIFAERNGIYLIDLNKTLRQLERAREVVSDIVGQGKRVLFVCTKRHLTHIVREEAEHEFHAVEGHLAFDPAAVGGDGPGGEGEAGRGDAGLALGGGAVGARAVADEAGDRVHLLDEVEEGRALKFFASYGRNPQSASNRIAPNANTSVRPSMFESPRACSGLM